PTPSYTSPLSLHDALPISRDRDRPLGGDSASEEMGGTYDSGSRSATRRTPRQAREVVARAHRPKVRRYGEECSERGRQTRGPARDRKSTRLNSSHSQISYA